MAHDDRPAQQTKAAPLDAAIVATSGSLTLTTLRDTLLPKLISGEPGAADAEQLLEQQP